MDYRKLIKEEIEKLHTSNGIEVNPKLDSDLGEQIVADICCKNQREQLKAFAKMVANDDMAYLKDADTLLKEFENF